MSVWYCNKHCQKSHWQEHKKVCVKKELKPTIAVIIDGSGVEQLGDVDATCVHCDAKLNEECYICKGMYDSGTVKKALECDHHKEDAKCINIDFLMGEIDKGVDDHHKGIKRSSGH